MWSTNEKTTKGIIVASLLSFSTYGSNAESIPTPIINDVQEISNLSGTHWTNTNVIEQKPNTHLDEAISIADIISLVKQTFGLPNKDIAQIFKVTRQTLYNYSKGSGVNHSINRKTQERSLHLKEIAQELSGKFKYSPGAMTKNHTIAGESLFKLLTQDELKIKDILEFADTLSQKINREYDKGTSSTSNDITLHELTRST